MSLPRVVLLLRRARPFFSRHPWVYAGAIAHVEGAGEGECEAADGQEVELGSQGGNFIARGFYNSRSKIRVRLYAWTPDVVLDEAFFRGRIDAAVRLREDILGLTGPGQACRLIFSEGDGLSGLTVDRYDQWLVVQFTALALGQRRE